MIRFRYRCPMRAEDMPRVAGGWQCTAGCGRIVVDLSALTEHDAEALVRDGRVCGRLLFDQLGKPVFAAAAGAALVAGVAQQEVAAGLHPPLAAAAAALMGGGRATPPAILASTDPPRHIPELDPDPVPAGEPHAVVGRVQIAPPPR